MKANEFFKAYGFDEVRYLVSLAGNARVCCIDGEHVHVDDLKRLVESHGVIEACGGIHMARADVMDLDGFEKTSPHWMKIKQAILDVESCQ